MSDLDLLLAIAGALVTILVVAGMVLITPRGQVEEAPDEVLTARAGTSSGAASAPQSTDHSSRTDPILDPEVRVDGAAGDLRSA